MGKIDLLLPAAVFFALHVAGSAKAQEASGLLDEVRAAHNASRQAIRTMSATIRVEATHPDHKVLGVGKYWRDGNTVRVHRNGVGGSYIDYRVSAGEVRQVVTPGTDPTY